MTFIIDETRIANYFHELPEWAQTLIKQKIKEIQQLSDPYSQGGMYRGKWAYPVGKLHLIAEINASTKSIILMKIIKLP